MKAHRIVLYSLPHRIFVGVTWLAFLGATGWAAASVQDGGGGDVLFVLALSLPVSFVGLGLMRARIELSADTATVIGFYSRRRVRKSEIVAVDVDRMAPWGLVIYLITERARIPAPAFQVGGLGSDSPSHQAMGRALYEIRRWLATPNASEAEHSAI